MSENKCKKRSGRKDRALAEATTRRNAKRRAAKEARLQGLRDAKRHVVNLKRKQGAVRRLERRIKGGATGLVNTLVKAQAAAKAAA